MDNETLHVIEKPESTGPFLVVCTFLVSDDYEAAGEHIAQAAAQAPGLIGGTGNAVTFDPRTPRNLALEAELDALDCDATANALRAALGTGAE